MDCKTPNGGYIVLFAVLAMSVSALLPLYTHFRAGLQHIRRCATRAGTASQEERVAEDLLLLYVRPLHFIASYCFFCSQTASFMIGSLSSAMQWIEVFNFAVRNRD